jgi:hypothetical protein
MEAYLSVSGSSLQLFAMAPALATELAPLGAVQAGVGISYPDAIYVLGRVYQYDPSTPDPKPAVADSCAEAQHGQPGA